MCVCVRERGRERGGRERDSNSDPQMISQWLFFFFMVDFFSSHSSNMIRNQHRILTVPNISKQPL